MIHRAVKPFIIGILVIIFSMFLFWFMPSLANVPHIDKVFHVSGGFIVAWFFVVLWPTEFKDLNKFQRVVACMAFATLIGFFWEIAEYSTSASFFTQHWPIIHQYFYGGDVTDTLGDLMADVLGGALFGLL